MNLNGSQLKELREALISAYPNKTDLEILISDAELEENLDAVAGGDNYKSVVFNLINRMKSNGKLEELIKAAYDENRNNQKLKVFVQSIQTIFDAAGISNKATCFPEHYWKELCLILTEINEKNINIITDACCCTLKNNSKNKDVLGDYPELTKLDIPSLKKILLEKCPYNDKQPPAPTIVEFTERLASDFDVEKPLQKKLKNWVESVAKQFNIDLPTYSKPDIIHRFLKPKPTLQSYLMIIVTPVDTNKVSLEAELISDYNDDNSEAPERIDLAQTQTNVICLFTEIADNIYRFIRESLTILNGKKGKKYKLTIEVFLPIQYLNKPIEFDEIKDVKPIGFEYYFLVRSLERFSNDEEHLNKLNQRWDELEALVNNCNQQKIQNIFGSLSEVDNCNWDDLENSWLFDKRLAIKVNCLLDSNVEQKKFFETILRAGVPISLWARCNNLIDLNQLDTFFHIKSLKDFNYFFESVWKLRRLAYAKQNEKAKYLGYNIGFLCDNPNRLPFRLMPDNQDFIETGY